MSNNIISPIERLNRISLNVEKSVYDLIVPKLRHYECSRLEGKFHI
jgi:hypothetical protein